MRTKTLWLTLLITISTIVNALCQNYNRSMNTDSLKLAKIITLKQKANNRMAQYALLEERDSLTYID